MTDEVRLNFQPEKFKVFVRFMIQVAKEKRCITYNELENIFGLSHKQVGMYAGALGHYCLFNEYPALNCLIINSTSCEPSDGFDWYHQQYNMSWGEMVSMCFSSFHITQTPSKKAQDFSGRDADISSWLAQQEAVDYVNGNFNYE